jgi:ketosteroid isomerase-like protein
MTPSTDVRSAVRELVAALDRYDTDAVLAALAPDVFYVLARELEPVRSREGCRDVIERWARAGLRVEACHAWNLEIRELGDGLATATHVLSFHLSGVPTPIRQHETLVLARDAAGAWLVVHGHRSPAPYEWAGGGSVETASSSALVAAAG